MIQIHKSALATVFLVCSCTVAQERPRAGGPVELLPSIAHETVIGSPVGEIVAAKTVYRNAIAHFQFPATQNASAYFVFRRFVHDPHLGCETLITETYLCELIALTKFDPHFRHWKTHDHAVPPIEWAISKHTHDGCHYEIYYRQDGHHWRLYGHFERDFPH